MINKPIDQITGSDLQELVTNRVQEGKLLEYKRTLPGPSDRERTEFLADVSSFANAPGGYLLYGIEAPDGIPVDMPGSGLSDKDADACFVL